MRILVHGLIGVLNKAAQQICKGWVPACLPESGPQSVVLIGITV